MTHAHQALTHDRSMFQAMIAPPARTGWLLVAALFVVGLLGHLLPAIRYFDAVPGDLGDGRLNSIFLEHLYRVVRGDDVLFWSPDFFYPYANVLALSDNHLGNCVVYLASRLAGLSREHAFDVWYLAGYTATFFAASFALRRLGLPFAACAAGAFIFAFNLPILAQEGHAQLIWRAGIPLACAAFWQALDRRSPVLLLEALAWTVWQFFCSIYLGLFLVYLLAAIAVGNLLLTRSVRLRPWLENGRMTGWPILVAGFVACTAPLIALLSVYRSVSAQYGLVRTTGEIGSMLPRAGSYLLSIPPYVSEEVQRALTASIPAAHEHNMFIGIGPVLLLAIGTVCAWLPAPPSARSLYRVVSIALVLLIVGTLSVGGYSLYFAVAGLPGVNAIRGVARIILVMMFPVALLAAFGVAWLTKAAGGWRLVAVILPVLAAYAASVETIRAHQGNTPISRWRERVEFVRARLPATLPQDAILFVRGGETGRYAAVLADLDAMILGQDLNRPTLNGYSASVLPGYDVALGCQDPAERLAAYAATTGDSSILARLSDVLVVDLKPCP